MHDNESLESDGSLLSGREEGENTKKNANKNKEAEALLKG